MLNLEELLGYLQGFPAAAAAGQQGILASSAGLDSACLEGSELASGTSVGFELLFIPGPVPTNIYTFTDAPCSRGVNLNRLPPQAEENLELSRHLRRNSFQRRRLSSSFHILPSFHYSIIPSSST